jgi:hypothetical protein
LRVGATVAQLGLPIAIRAAGLGPIRSARTVDGPLVAGLARPAGPRAAHATFCPGSAEAVDTTTADQLFIDLAVAVIVEPVTDFVRPRRSVAS